MPMPKAQVAANTSKYLETNPLIMGKSIEFPNTND
jgi:hypothetical protein